MTQAPQPAAAADQFPPAADQLPAITLGVMQTVCANYAVDIEDREHTDVEVGFRKAVRPDKMEEARVLREIGELIGRLRNTPAALEALGLKRPDKAAGKGS